MATTATQWGRHQWGKHLWGGGGSGALPAPIIPGTKILPDKWTVEVENASGVLQRRMPYWTSGQMTGQIGAHGKLRLAYPYDVSEFPESASLVQDNVIVIRNQDGTVHERYHIASRTKNATAAGLALWEIEGQSLQSQLADEGVEFFDTATEPGQEAGDHIGKLTVEQIVVALLSRFQNNASPISIGVIDPAIGSQKLAIQLETTSILGALNEVHKTIGGWWFVRHDRKLYWRRQLYVGAPRLEIRLGVNMLNMSVKERFDTVAAQVVAFGAGTDHDTRLRSVRPETAPANAKIRFVTDSAIHKQDELDAWAQATLDRLSPPTKSRDVGALDMSMADSPDIDFSYANLYLGQPLGLVHPVLGETISTFIAKITRDMVNETAVTLEMTDPDSGTDAWGNNPPVTKRDISDMVAAQQDAKISAQGRDAGVLDSMIDHAEKGRLKGVQRLFEADTLEDIQGQVRGGDIVTAPGDRWRDENDLVRELGADGKWRTPLERLNNDLATIKADPFLSRRDYGEQTARAIFDNPDATTIVNNARTTRFGADIKSIGEANDGGNSADAAHDNHIHSANYGGGVASVGAANAEGSNTATARDDHEHDLTAMAGSDIQSNGSANTGGSNDEYARDDHGHLVVWAPYSGP